MTGGVTAGVPAGVVLGVGGVGGVWRGAGGGGERLPLKVPF